MLNEARNLPHVFTRLPGELFETIMVDGGSTDGSVEVAREVLPSIRIVTQDRRGKGNALECGFRACRGDNVVFLDADGSTDPAEIPHFVAALLNGADFAKGSRFAAGGSSLDITPVRQRGNRVLCGIVNRLYGTAYTDLYYGFNAIWRHRLRELGFDGSHNGHNGDRRRGDGFEVETLINVRAATAGLTVIEVPSSGVGAHPRQQQAKRHYRRAAGALGHRPGAPHLEARAIRARVRHPRVRQRSRPARGGMLRVRHHLALQLC